MSRKISQDAVKSFMEGRMFSRDNTVVTARRNEQNGQREAELILHGNCIARRRGSRVEICDGGFKSRTTQERVNALAFHYGARVTQKNWTWYLSSKLNERQEMEADTWYVIQEGTPMEMLVQGITT